MSTQKKMVEQELIDFMESLKELLQQFTALSITHNAIKDLPEADLKKLKGTDIKKLIRKSLIHGFELVGDDIDVIKNSNQIYAHVLLQASHVPQSGYLDILDAEVVINAINELQTTKPEFFTSFKKFYEELTQLSSKLGLLDNTYREANKFSEIPDLSEVIDSLRSVSSRLLEMHDIDKDAFFKSTSKAIESLKDELHLTRPEIGSSRQSIVA